MEGLVGSLPPIVEEEKLVVGRGKCGPAATNVPPTPDPRTLVVVSMNIDKPILLAIDQPDVIVARDTAVGGVRVRANLPAIASAIAICDAGGINHIYNDETSEGAASIGKVQEGCSQRVNSRGVRCDAHKTRCHCLEGYSRSASSHHIHLRST